MIWLNGVLHEAGPVPFDPGDRGLTLADGVFDTLSAFGGIAWRREDHLARLAAAAAQIRIPIGRDRLEEGLDALLARAKPGGSVVRLTVTRGAGARGLALPAEPHPTVLATLAPWNPELVFRPVRLALAEARRNDRSPLARLKTLGYLDSVLAFDQAVARGFDDALFLNTAGRAASSTMANLFVLRGRHLRTPPGSDGVLAGTVRARVMALAGGLGLDAEERPLTREDLAAAEAMFLTNSVRLVTPVVAFEDRALPGATAAARPILDALLAEIEAECGVALAVRRD